MIEGLFLGVFFGSMMYVAYNYTISDIATEIAVRSGSAIVYGIKSAVGFSDTKKEDDQKK